MEEAGLLHQALVETIITGKSERHTTNILIKPIEFNVQYLLSNLISKYETTIKLYWSFESVIFCILFDNLVTIIFRH